MKLYLFIFLYGAVGIKGMFSTWFWGIVAHKRIKVFNPPVYNDRYFVIAASIAVMSFGLMVNCLARTYGNIDYGLSPILLRTEGSFILTGLAFVILGFFGFIWLADLETDPINWKYSKRVGFVTVLWGIATFFIIQFVPLQTI